MNPQNPQPQNNNQEDSQANKSVLQAFSVILLGLLIAITILFSSGIGSDILFQVRYVLPKFGGNYNSVKDINDYENLYTVLSSQPQLSYNSKSKLVLLETGDANCPDCATVHGYKVSSNAYSFNKLKQDFIESGKIDYVFIDSLISNAAALTENSIQKHNSVYCVAEQNPGASFDYKDKVYQSYANEFNLNKAKSWVNVFGFDSKKFEDCFNSKKYQDRVNKLSTFSKNVLQNTAVPTFYIFQTTDKEVTKADGSKVMEKEYTLVDKFSGTIDYDIFMKSRLQTTVDKYGK